MVLRCVVVTPYLDRRDKVMGRTYSLLGGLIPSKFSNLLKLIGFYEIIPLKFHFYHPKINLF